jgi:lipopolysaccharide/colanic/teichoic acid biosynthesis glycosyltransferase
MYLIFKRLIDIIFAIIVLSLTSPLLLFLIVFLTIANQGKPFFFQTRPGLNAKSFRIVKFKTMNDKTDAEGKLLPDSERLTKVGSWVRKSSLDELPQFINVLKGDMSLIGPRPLLMRYVPLYNEWQMRRHEVRPGITGWAQVNGRNQVPWPERFEMDVWYVENRSLLLDLRIIGLTIQKVVKREGIAAEGTVGMNPFLGNDQ